MRKLKATRTGKHGQTSVEYLVLLAIAIVIAVVAVGVLAGFIKIGTSTTYKKKGAIYWKSADIGIMDWEVFDTSKAGTYSTLVLQNNKEYQVVLDWISTDGGASTYPLDITLLPGDVYKWENTNISCNSKGSYSYTLTFQYENKENGVRGKQFTGAENLAGTCSN